MGLFFNRIIFCLTLLPVLYSHIHAAHAHTPPIHPVLIDLRVDPGQIRAHFDVNQVFWEKEILQSDAKPGACHESDRTKILAYVASHFVLKADKQVLEPKLQTCAFYQNPWQNEFEGRLAFDISYSIPSPPDKLNFTSTFYIEEYSEEQAHENCLFLAFGDHHPWTFETHIKFPETWRKRNILSIKNPSWSIKWTDIVRPSVSRLLESLKKGLWHLIKYIPLWFFLLALPLYWPQEKTPHKIIGLFFAILFFSLFLPLPLNTLLRQTIPWGFLVIIGFCPRRTNKIRAAIVIATAPLWGILIHPHITQAALSFQGFSSLSFGSGVIIGGGLAYGLLYGGVWLFKKHLNRLWNKDTANRHFDAYRFMITCAIGAIGVFQIIKIFREFLFN